MQPGPSDDPGQRGGELPGAGSPKVNPPSEADGPNFGAGAKKLWDKTKDLGGATKKWAYDSPHCVEGSYYDVWGGGGGVCFDLKKQVIQPKVEVGAGAGGSFKVSDPDKIQKHGYGYVGVGGGLGPANGYCEIHHSDADNGVVPSKKSFSDDCGGSLGIPLRRNGVSTDGLERSPKSDGEHTGKPGGPWVKQNGGAHRGNPSLWRELFKKGGFKANAQGKVYVGRAWTIDLTPWN